MNLLYFYCHRHYCFSANAFELIRYVSWPNVYRNKAEHSFWLIVLIVSELEDILKYGNLYWAMILYGVSYYYLCWSHYAL
jgi:hypothetical protein